MKELIGKKIGAIIVLYNPDKDLIVKILDRIKNQVNDVFISDNSKSNHEYLFRKYSNVKYQYLSGNKGIATAQNVGIDFFKKNNFDFILFLDQDSIPTQDLVSKLYHHYTFLNDKFKKVGGIGARPYNRSENKKYEGSIIKGHKITNNLTEVSEIISSSSLIPIDVFKKIGGMEDDLFIDAVDFEFCWRANYIDNLKFFIAEDVLLSHQLGEGDRFFLYRKVAIPTPFRVYYQIRNYLRLLPRRYVPTYWKVSNGIKYLIKYFYYPIFISPRKEYFLQMNKGIMDGIKSLGNIKK